MRRQPGLTTTQRVHRAQFALEEFLAGSEHAGSGLIAVELRKWIDLTGITCELVRRRGSILRIRRNPFRPVLVLELADIGASYEELAFEVRRFGRLRVRVSEPAGSRAVSWTDSNGVRFINRGGTEGVMLIWGALKLV